MHNFFSFTSDEKKKKKWSVKFARRMTESEREKLWIHAHNIKREKLIWKPRRRKKNINNYDRRRCTLLLSTFRVMHQPYTIVRLQFLAIFMLLRPANFIRIAFRTNIDIPDSRLDRGDAISAPCIRAFVISQSFLCSFFLFVSLFHCISLVQTKQAITAIFYQ